MKRTVVKIPGSQNIMVPLPAEVERLWKSLFCFSPGLLANCMPFLPLGEGFSLGQFVRLGRGRRTERAGIVSALKSELEGLSLAELWATLLLTMKTDCLDPQTPLGSFLVVLEEYMLDALAKKLMKEGMIATRKIGVARETIVAQLNFLLDGYRGACEVFGQPVMLLENCCGGCDLPDDERARKIIYS